MPKLIAMHFGDSSTRGQRACLKNPPRIRGLGFGVLPLGGSSVVPPKGGTPNRVSEHALRIRVPEGEVRIAQHFNAGFTAGYYAVPKRRLRVDSMSFADGGRFGVLSVIQPSLRDSRDAPPAPALKRRASLAPSRRD